MCTESGAWLELQKCEWEEKEINCIIAIMMVTIYFFRPLQKRAQKAHDVFECKINFRLRNDESDPN